MTAGADVRRSFAVLRGMTGPEGATVAAATTSLPERSEAGRNYDYRYCWVRDICYIGHAGAAVEGGEAVLDDAVRWVAARLLADGSAMSPAYLPEGTAIPDERSLGVPGYPGGFDVIGNRVRTQFQLDLIRRGSAPAWPTAAGRDRLDVDAARAVELAIAAIERCWNEPDNGVWETEPARWTHSRLICVAGLRAIAGSRVPTSLDGERCHPGRPHSERDRPHEPPRRRDGGNGAPTTSGSTRRCCWPRSAGRWPPMTRGAGPPDEPL